MKNNGHNAIYDGALPRFVDCAGRSGTFCGAVMHWQAQKDLLAPTALTKFVKEVHLSETARTVGQLDSVLQEDATLFVGIRFIVWFHPF